MQFNTRTAMLRGLELRKRLGSWEAVEQFSQPLTDLIDILRPSADGEHRSEDSAHAAE